VIRRLGRQDGGLRRSLSSGRALRGPGGLQSAYELQRLEPPCGIENGLYEKSTFLSSSLYS
jgi:hypothetical protein